jgi:coiled-coil domain-containing protein 130
MSSLAAARADNFYFPPGWTPDKGSLNKYHGVPPGHLGVRAKKMDQGILVIRFETPFDFWCDGCKNHVAKGVRYNAEKKAVGNYFSTKIWQFSMTCHRCSSKIVFKTDPRVRLRDALTRCAILV